MIKFSKDNRLITWSLVASAIWALSVVVFSIYWGHDPARPLGLNEIADVVAGATSPLALLWFLVTVYLQWKGLAETAASAQAERADTFRLELFERRLRVRQDLEKAAYHIQIDDPDSYGEGIRLLADTIDIAEFICGPRVLKTLHELRDNGLKARYFAMEYDRLQPFGDSLDEVDNARMDKAIDGRYKIARWMIEELTPIKLNELFRPYLQMPEPSTS
jgi:hypothetical protein